MPERTDREQLPRAALIDRVRQLQMSLATLTAEVAALRARVTELEAGPSGSPPKTPDSSSIPPSRGFTPNRAERRAQKRGPQRGHAGMSHRRQEPDTIVRCHPATCHGCGGDLTPAPRRRVGRRQVIEFPELQPGVIDAWLYAAACPACGERTTGAAPAGMEPPRTFGPRSEALVASLQTAQHRSHERLVAVCGSVVGLRIRAGAIAAALARVAGRAAPDVARIAATVRGRPVIKSDETGVRGAGDNWWQWVFQTPEASFHTIVAATCRRRSWATSCRRCGAPTPAARRWAPRPGTLNCV